jgi:hypothetical protein
MKLRNHETGEVFNNLQQAADVFCLNYDSYCHGCPIDKANGGRACRDWIQKHPHEAARLMGLEVVEENSNKLKETLINDNKEGADMDKPRICKVLGVEVGKRFRIDYPKSMTVWLHINKEGFVVREGGPKNLKIGNLVAWAINHPESIIRKPRWTQQEMDLAKLLYDFRRSKSVVIERNKGHILWWRDGDSAEGILPYKLFPSLNCGESVKLSDIASPHPPG